MTKKFLFETSSDPDNLSQNSQDDDNKELGDEMVFDKTGNISKEQPNND